MKLILCSNNKNKISEIKAYLADVYEILSMSDVWVVEDIPEPFHTFEENSLTKAQYVFDKLNISAMSDDSGLCVEALDGEPGVLSARYSGDHDDAANMKKLLQELDWRENRNAKFVCVISLILDGEVHQFRWECTWKIATKWDWNLSFGYDPIFIPDGYEQTFCELWKETKNQISHRTKAVQKMVEFLKNK